MIDSEEEGTIGLKDRDSKGTTTVTMATEGIGMLTLGTIMGIGTVTITLLIGDLKYHPLFVLDAGNVILEMTVTPNLSVLRVKNLVILRGIARSKRKEMMLEMLRGHKLEEKCLR